MAAERAQVGYAPAAMFTPRSETSTPWHRTACLSLFSTFAIGLLAACGSEPVGGIPERPNLVLVVLCSLRHDHLGFAGYDRPTTPFLDELAEQSTRFERFVSASAQTKPSSASLFTGLTPNVHRLVDPYSMRQVIEGGEGEPPRTLSDGVETLAESLQRAGYATGCRINNVNAGEFFNLDQGCEDSVTSHYYPTSRMLDDLGSFLDGRDPEQPFFYLLFTLDAHVPYAPEYDDFLRFHQPEELPPQDSFGDYLRSFQREIRRLIEAGEPVPEELQRRYVDAYDAALASLDRRLSRLPEVLAEAGVEGETLIFVTADHGESFFDPGRVGMQQITHGRDLSQHLVHIPLLVHGPGIEAGGRVSQLARSIDLYPTLVELAGGEPPDILQGRSLVPFLTGAEPEPEPVTAFLSRNDGQHHAVIDGRYKLQSWKDERFELYDLSLDPFETEDLFEQEPALARQLLGELQYWREQEEVLAPIVGTTGSRELPPEMIEQLDALGYL